MKQQNRLIAIFASIVMALCLVGCFELPLPLADSEEHWDSLGVDESLLGDWEYEGDITSFEIHEDGFLIMSEIGSDETPEFAIRTFEQDGVKFFLVVQFASAVSDFEDEDVKYPRLGFVFQYAIEDDAMVWRLLKFEVLEEAIESGAVAGSLDEEGNEDEYGLSSLDAPTIAWLVEAFSDDDNIEEEWGPILRLEDSADE